MAPKAFVYSLYEIHSSQIAPFWLLVRVTRPAYSKASPAEEDWAHQQENQQRTRLLCSYQIAHRATYRDSCALTLSGTYAGEPPGDIRYERFANYHNQDENIVYR